jgi:DNA-binding beta-propeller fold protein YncE
MDQIIWSQTGEIEHGHNPLEFVDLALARAVVNAMTNKVYVAYDSSGTVNVVDGASKMFSPPPRCLSAVPKTFLF